MNHSPTSTRRPTAVSALALLGAAALLATGAALLGTDQSARHPSTLAGSIVPVWNNTGSTHHPEGPQS